MKGQILLAAWAQTSPEPCLELIWIKSQHVVQSLISTWHSFGYPLLKPHQTTYQSNKGVCLKKISNWITSYLPYRWFFELAGRSDSSGIFDNFRDICCTSWDSIVGSGSLFHHPRPVQCSCALVLSGTRRYFLQENYKPWWCERMLLGGWVLHGYSFWPPSSLLLGYETRDSVSMRWLADRNRGLSSHFPHNFEAHMSIWFFVKVKILMPIKWSYRFPKLCWWLLSSELHDIFWAHSPTAFNHMTSF